MTSLTALLQSVNWEAVSAIATTAAVCVALFPIYADAIQTRRREMFRMEQIRSVLISLETILRATPERETVGREAPELVSELAVHIAQLRRTDTDTLRVLLAAASAARVLSAVGGAVDPNSRPGLRDATLKTIGDSLAVLDRRKPRSQRHKG